ncbi:hypothetical protein HN789_03940 [archaeon]|jgi:hypothetical protein|nr:hypothetical protein [archaeon]MBT4273139.1 hypothetical protein [archaeon]MBT4460966.1 hypothetical protein [archaeon]MBT4858301.1 hypothetical protein [archaeon]MBT5423192.1 hypothetical protein [archaeon]
MKNIETGVDKLVELVNKEKKISIDDAAKTLGISTVVIREWAEFLDEEKIISIEYKFSKTVLLERKLSEKEVTQKQKEYSSEKDAFVRKVENSIKTLEKDSLGLEKIKKEFSNLKKQIGGEISQVEKEVKDLEKYEYLKKNLDKDIKKQVEEFHQILDKAHKDLDYEQKKHQELLEDLDIEKREAVVKEHRIMSLEQKEENLMKRIQEIISISKQIEKKLDEEKIDLKSSKKRVINIEKAVDGIEENILKKKNYIEPLLNKAKKHEQDILDLQDEILQKAKQKTAAIKSQIGESVKATSKFKDFFKRKSEIENLIDNIDKEKTDLEKDFLKLEKKALAFDLSTKSNVVSTHIKELEKNLTTVDKKRSLLKQNLEKLIKLIKG